MVNDFEEDIKKSLNRFGLYHTPFVWYKTNDNLKPTNLKDRLLVGPCPADFFCAHNQTLFLIECKATAKIDEYPLSHIKLKQIDLMTRWQEVIGAKCYYLIKDVKQKIVIMLTLDEMKGIIKHSSQITPEILATLTDKRIHVNVDDTCDLRTIFLQNPEPKPLKEAEANRITLQLWEAQALIKIKDAEIKKLRQQHSKHVPTEEEHEKAQTDFRKKIEEIRRSV
jgi:penicillin-binding protein-related factor A (putative recombinase)